MKILFISNLFPDRANPNRGSDNGVLLEHLSAKHEIRVIALRPALVPFGGDFTACPQHEKFQPVYCKTGYIPKIGSRWNHRLMARTLVENILAVRQKFAFDIVLTSWIYPDACATALAAKELKFPFVAIAQGSDVHQYLEMPARREIIRKLLPGAAAVITRSEDLARRLREIGIEDHKIKTVYNGIDRSIFQPAFGGKQQIKKELGMKPDVPMLLFVGNFLPIKNIPLLLQARAGLKNPTQLVLLGSGPLRNQISGPDVILPGRKRPVEVARYMQAADVLCLSSDNEGFPNVILEAFACGLPVVSTNVGGIAELVNENYLGVLTKKGDAHELTEGLASVLNRSNDSKRISEYGAQFSWERAAAAYDKVLTDSAAAWRCSP